MQKLRAGPGVCSSPFDQEPFVAKVIFAMDSRKLLAANMPDSREVCERDSSLG